ncbi:MAG TPA: hypothetical protein VGI92_14630 [Gemmatimonadales bacterium]
MINFHRLLITTAIMFCAAFAVWMFRSWQGTHAVLDIAASVIFALLAVGLSIYLANLNRFLKT